MPPSKHILYLVLALMLTWTLQACQLLHLCEVHIVGVERMGHFVPFCNKKLTHKFPVSVSLPVPSFAWREIHFPLEGTGCAGLSA